MNSQIQGQYLPGSSEAEDLTEFQPLVSLTFHRHFRKADDALKDRLVECITDLATGSDGWKARNVKKPKPETGHSLRTAAVDMDVRIIFEGPSSADGLPKPVLYIHDFSDHDDLSRTIKKAISVDVSDSDFEEFALDTPVEESRLQPNRLIYTKYIPPLALADPQRVKRMLESENENWMLSEAQLEALGEKRPLLIHGQAGTGKTILLCHALAESAVRHKRMPELGQLLYITYNERLVDSAKELTANLLHYVWNEDRSLVDQLSFMRFADLLRQFTTDKLFTDESAHVSFGRFRVLYEEFRRGSRAGRRVSPELAWHAIRSMLKGACLPPSRPPMSRDNYEALARSRKEFDAERFDDLYSVALWYQERAADLGLWDDQDLSWAALNWIREVDNEDVIKYSEIFCDEVQDLTPIEFSILTSLVQPAVENEQTIYPLTIAGDPLQTINPTGFRWSVAGAEIYRVAGVGVTRRELSRNYRSDKRIVELANKIQAVRSKYIGEALVDQESPRDDGDIPIVIVAEDENETEIVASSLIDPPADTTIIVWPEEEIERQALIRDDPLLTALAQDEETLKLFVCSVFEAKGTEARLVVLYRFGSHPEVKRWIGKVAAEGWSPSHDEQLPLAYFLNRLYVSVTRAKSYLLIVDDQETVEKFWLLWENVAARSGKDHISCIQQVSRGELRASLENWPALQAGINIADYAEWAEHLFKSAERDDDVREYERAEIAFRRAGETARARKVRARIAELRQDWETAANLYLEDGLTHKAATCLERGRHWARAAEAYSRVSPKTPDIFRKKAVCDFNAGVESGEKLLMLNSAKEFFEFTSNDTSLELDDLRRLADVLERTDQHSMAARTHERIAQATGEPNRYVEAGRCWYAADEMAHALAAFNNAGGYEKIEYPLCWALEHQESEPLEASRIYAADGRLEDAIRVGQGLKGRAADELMSEIYMKTQSYSNAAKRYERLIRGARSDASARAEYRRKLGGCLELAGEKLGAMKEYIKADEYDEAARVAHDLDRPSRQIQQLKLRGAQQRGEWKVAVRIAKEIGDAKLASSLRGEQLKAEGKHAEAIEHFTAAKEWQQVILCAFNAQAITITDEAELTATVARAIPHLESGLASDDRSILRQRLSELRDVDDWEKIISPKELGPAYEAIGLVEAIDFYERYTDSKVWARDGWLRVKERQRQDLLQRADKERALAVERRMAQQAERWRKQGRPE